jgi:hypothetical protein
MSPVQAPVTPQALLDAMEGIAYLTDQRGVIVAIGQTRWDAFAKDNDWREGQASRVVGRTLFDTLAGRQVREAATKVHEAVASGRRPTISYHYRCDAPSQKRQMRMAITCVECSGTPMVLYQSQLLSATSRPPMGLFGAPSPEAARDPSIPFVSVCSYCHSVAWPPGAEDREWIEPEAYYVRGGSGDVSVTHGICPRCLEDVLKDLD